MSSSVSAAERVRPGEATDLFARPLPAKGDLARTRAGLRDGDQLFAVVVLRPLGPAIWLATRACTKLVPPLKHMPASKIAEETNTNFISILLPLSISHFGALFRYLLAFIFAVLFYSR